MPAEAHYRWEWELRSRPEQLWPLVADTNRFNRDTGVPAVEEGGVGANARRRLRFSKLGVPLVWEEEPFEWVRPHRFSVVRRYRRGPLTELRVMVQLTPRNGGTLVRYDVRARPRNVLGRVATPVQIGWLSRRRFEAAFRRYDELAANGSVAVETALAEPATLVAGGEQRAAAGAAAVVEQGVDAALVDRLLGLVLRGDDLSVVRIRPYVLADAWGVDRRAVLELCLHAVRAGLLDFRWDLLCPLCRGARRSVERLRDVERQVHCDTCQIDFEVNFEASVELTFRVNVAIRQAEENHFCVAGPQTTPHVAVQQLLAPGDVRVVEPQLEEGRYRLRTLGLRGARPVRAAEGGAREATVRLDAGGWADGELTVAPAPRVEVANETGEEQLVVLERTAWSDTAVTAAEVTSLQLFRDLFSAEALRPGEPISVGTLTVLFTDLRDSTRFYREVGDAPAFGSVMEHLDVLREAVTDEGGAIVKAMGDAIMATFPRPAPALRAALAAQSAEASPPAGRRPLYLKVGIHTGPCIAVTQNGRLDYFGSTVNLAARLVPLSSGADVVVSNAVLEDPEVAELVHGSRIKANEVEATLKGFDDERFVLWRLSVRDAADSEVAHVASPAT